MDHVTLQDGRRLDYRVTGPEDGTPLLFLHGTPGAGTERDWLEEPAHDRGLRVVSWSRPGYGGSSRQEGRKVVDVVVDAAQLLASIGSEQCFVVGGSGGGPHSLACAARLPGVKAALAIASVTPFDADDIDWLAGMGQDNIEEFRAAVKGEEVLRPFLESESVGIGSATIEGLISSISSLLPEVDIAVMTDEVAASVLVSMAEAIRTGVDGWLDDDLAFVTDWGFELDEISVPVSLWQGSEDLMVPFAHGQWLAERLPTASVHLEQGEGHLSITVGAIEAMYDDMIALADRG